MCQNHALTELDGLGDPAAGEWHEWSGTTYHVRRRLSADEQRLVGPAVDIRHTLEASVRAAELRGLLRFVDPAILRSEID